MTSNTPVPEISGVSIWWRIVLTALLFAVYGFINHLTHPVATLAAGKVAGNQFNSNDMDAVTSYYGVNFFGHIGWPFIVYLAMLVWIWWKPLKAIAHHLWAAFALSLILAIGIAPQARAYYEKTDWPEIYFVLPNESAFWIPDTGDNKTDQKKFMSEDYLNANKIAAKRFQVPHVQLPKSSWTMDYYVPAGRLIIVDRTPYARQWTADPTSGTGNANESLKCQSADGLDITVGVAISASVFEQDAPRFLYRFGVKPPVGDRNTDAVKFQSVYYGKSLTEVMDTVVKGKIQALICAEFSPKTLDAVNASAHTIMTESDTKVRSYLIEQFGITLDYLGWGDTFEFDPKVQNALNDRYAADKLTPVMPVLERQAQIEVQRAVASALISFGQGVKEKGLPSNLVVLPGNLGDIGSTLVGAAATVTGMNAKPGQPAPAPRPVTPPTSQ